ncbi:hypothetical protein ACWDXD_24715 [Streptomyces sp. NPDC003314]
MNTHVPYIGGPFAGGANPDSFIEEIAMSSPAGVGRYVLEPDPDEEGRQVYRWIPEKKTSEPGHPDSR